MNNTKIAAIAGFVALSFSGAALAADMTTSSVSNMQNGNQVTLTGTVESFDSQHSFTLRDSTGTVKIDLSAAKPVVLKNGDTVSVIGTVDKGMIQTDVLAQSVSEEKGIGAQIGSAIDSVTGQDQASNAKTSTIASLPSSGLVKVNGVVDSVSSEKKFTLKDATGNIDVSMKGKSASLNKGTQVAVIGYVNKGMFSTSIVATNVEVMDASAQ